MILCAGNAGFSLPRARHFRWKSAFYDENLMILRRSDGPGYCNEMGEITHGSSYIAIRLKADMADKG